jgi:hypothetical protein
MRFFQENTTVNMSDNLDQIMKLRLLALAALAALSFNASAGLTTYAPWDAHWNPSKGLRGVQFNVAQVDAATGVTGASLAMGAHPFKSGVTMPNNGVDTYYAMAGLTEPQRAKWSFDYAADFGNCVGCTVKLFIDADPTSGLDMRQLTMYGGIIDSGNLEFGYMSGPFGINYNFDPFSASSTGFSLRMFNAANVQIGNSDITVNVPEPGSLTLLGLGLVGMGAMLRRSTRS